MKKLLSTWLTLNLKHNVSIMKRAVLKMVLRAFAFFLNTHAHKWVFRVRR